MDSLIGKCHAWRNETHTQRQTEVFPSGYNEYPYHFRVHYAHEESARLYHFEQSDISVLPIGKAPFDRAPSDWLRKDPHRNRVDERQGAQDWRPRQWFASWGIGIYTGETSGRDGAHWHDVEFTYQAILDEPDTTLVCLEALISAVKDPLVTLTKDGGVRFTCRVQDYQHPNTVDSKFHAYKDQPTFDNAYVIIKGEQDYSVWDAHHKIDRGSIFNPPVISKDVLFALINFFRILLDNPAWSDADKRSVHIPKALDTKNTIKALSVDEKAIYVSQQIHDIRNGQLSPLAIQRPAPVITKQPLTEPVLKSSDHNHRDGTLQPNFSDILNSDADVIGIQTGLRDASETREIERTLVSHFGGADRVCILRTLFPSNLFVKHELSIDTINNYTQSWHILVLGDFGYALRNALQIIESDKTDNIVARVRAVVSAFENVKETLIVQMYEVDGAGDTYWHQLKRFFDHYPRDADAPMYFDGHALWFQLPPMIDPCTEKFVFLSPTIEVDILQRVYPCKKVAVYDYAIPGALSGHRVYQLRSEVHSPHSLLNYDLDWDALSLSDVGTRYAVGMHQEIRRMPEKQHIIVSAQDMDEALSDTLSESNVHFSLFHARHIDENQTPFEDMFEAADVVWMFGTPYVQPVTIWRHAKMLYGDMAQSLDYTVSTYPYRFKDPRLQQLSEAYSRQILIAMLAYAGLSSEVTGKTLVILTALWLPGITDAPETHLFDWEDFEVADGLEGLDAVIDTREQYEAEVAKIDASWMPYQIMPILGVDYREAERLLIERYGRDRFVRVSEEVVALLSERGTPMQQKEIKAVLSHRSPSSIDQSLKQLVNEGVVSKIRWGLYGLKTD